MLRASRPEKPVTLQIRRAGAEHTHLMSGSWLSGDRSNVLPERLSATAQLLPTTVRSGHAATVSQTKKNVQPAVSEPSRTGGDWP